MARKQIPEAQSLKSWADVDSALREIAENSIVLHEIDAELSRQTIARFERYQNNFCIYIATVSKQPLDLSMQYNALQAEIDALNDQRHDRYKQRRRRESCADLTREIEGITMTLRRICHDLKLCARIEDNIAKLHEVCRSNIVDVFIFCGIISL